ncbi:MAG: Clp protease ClpP [Betaproteobacteria bacterium]|nr:Clp protease ClpP [Betaproteobacteria bacterium]
MSDWHIGEASLIARIAGPIKRHMPGELRALLPYARGEVLVFLDSPGGDGDAAREIHDMLRAHPHQITVFISGHADSSASLIAMAGRRIWMSPSARMLLHNPVPGRAVKNAPGMRAVADAQRGAISAQQSWHGVASVINGAISEALAQPSATWVEEHAAQYAKIYARRTRRPVSEMRRLMEIGTDLSAQQAVAKGFADRIAVIELPREGSMGWRMPIYSHARPS